MTIQVTAPAPTATAAKLTISVGLLSLPVKLLKGTDEAGFARKQFTAGGQEVGYAPAIKVPDGKGNWDYTEIIPRSEIVKKAETAHGLVEITDDEIARLLQGDPKRADLLCVQPFEVLDNDYVASGMIWQVVAEKGAEEPFDLLLSALDKMDCFALIRWTRGGTQYVGALHPNGVLAGLRFDEEVRALVTRPKFEHAPDKLNQAVNLLEVYLEKEPQRLEHPHQRIWAYAEAKAAGENPQLEKTESTKAVFDNLSELLNQSIEAARQAREKVSA